MFHCSTQPYATEALSWCSSLLLSEFCLNLATVSRVVTVPSPATVPLLSRILPSDACKIYKQGLNIRQVLSAGALSFRKKKRDASSVAGGLRLNVHTSALWDLTGSLFVCQECGFVHDNLSLVMDKVPTLLSSVPAPGCLIWYSKCPLIILELEGERDGENEGKWGGSF